MPNVLNPEPAHAFLARAATKISAPHIAERFARLALPELLKDPTCLRLADGDELNVAPAWAKAAIARGALVHVFKLSRSASARFNGVARRLEQTCKLAQSADPSQEAFIALARDFLEKIDRADFETVRRKSAYFARIFDNADCDEDDRVCCEAQSLICANGRVWRRVTNIAALRETGREFRNCLARTTASGGYGRKLHRGAAQFWVLRERDNRGLIIAMAPLPLPAWFSEVYGPRNARIPGDDADLLRLARAIGIIAGDPPPPSSAAATAPATALTPVFLSRRAA